MSEYLALMWDIKPGAEEAVAALFADYASPELSVRDDDGNEVGRLLGTQVFLKGTTVVRVIEFEGPVQMIRRHMSKQTGTHALEDDLQAYLESPRDMNSPDGVRAFFSEAGMRCLVARRFDG